MLAVVLTAGYGYQASHTAIGIDDTPAALQRYFDTGELILTGRITPFLLHRLFPGYTYNTALATAVTALFLGLAGLVLAAVIYAVQKRPADARGYLIPCALASYPLLAEILFYMQQQMGIGFAFFFAASGTALLAEHILCGRGWAAVPGGILLVAAAAGDYEAFAAVYLSMFLAVVLAWQWSLPERLSAKRWVFCVLRGVWPLAAALAVKAAVTALLKIVYAPRLEGLTANAAQHLRWLENGPENFLQTLTDLVSGILVDYAAMAFAWLPFTLLFAGFLVLAVQAAVRAVKEKNGPLLWTALLLCAAQFSLSVLQGQAQYTRASECFAVFCGFVLWLTVDRLLQSKTVLRRAGAALLAAVILAGQIVCLNFCFWLDTRRWQEEEKTLLQAAETLQSCDLTKPVVFTGTLQSPQDVVARNTVPAGNWSHKVYYLCSLVFGVPNTDLYYSANAMPSVIDWSLDAFGLPQTQIYSLFELVGYRFVPCTLEQQQAALEVAPQLASGSVTDMGEYLIYNF